MMNILTWDIKPIQVPKVNSNLLSAVSLILILTMAFLTAAVIADHCDDEKRAVDEAAAEVDRAFKVYLEAEIILLAALATLNPIVIWKAYEQYRRAKDRLKAAGDAYVWAVYWYQACLAEHDDAGSGGCS